VVSLIYDDPRVKIKTIHQIVLQYLILKKQVLYIDFDIQFSSMVQNLSEKEFGVLSSLDLSILTPNDPMEIFDSLITSPNESGLVVIDTLNTMQRLFLHGPTDVDARTANHKSAVLISAIQETIRPFRKTLMILSLTRSRPNQADEGVTWHRGLAGGRMARFKSDLILTAQEITGSGNIVPRVELSVDAVLSRMFPGASNDVYGAPTD
jgi:hypothetical protein